MTTGRPKLLLHCCCAPCTPVPAGELLVSREVLLFFYNPNIEPEEEYRARLNEIAFHAQNKGYPLVEGPYENGLWTERIHGMEHEPEGGLRCEACFRMRLEKTAEEAVKQGCDEYCTTLSISPHKNAALINRIGKEIECKLGIRFIEADFKKKDGFRKSCEISKKEKFYRQDYCGCLFSRRHPRQPDP